MAARTIGRYVVREEIGQGGMATVYRALDPHFQRDVAIKVLPLHFLHDPRFRARFEREARIVAGLQHPAIVPVYDFGEDNGQPYLVMALMSGGSLEDRLRQGPMPLVETERIIGRLAPALDAAHQRGVIHRDLKPANILFDQWNEPYLTDFGIVKLTQGSSDDSASLTTVGGIIGTPAYMSPEQVQGAVIDGRSDIYSLGVILFQMLSGRLPYDATTPIGLAFKHISEPIPSIQAMGNVRLPAEFQTIVNQAMAKLANDRYPTAVALARDLTRVVHGSGPRPTVVVPPAPGGLAATQRVEGPPSAPQMPSGGPPAYPSGGPSGWPAVPPQAAAPTARVEAPLPVASSPAARAERRGPPIWLLGLLALLLVGGGAAAFLLLRNGGNDGDVTPTVGVVAPAFTASPTATTTAAATAAIAEATTAATTATAGEPTTVGSPTPRPLKTAVTPLAPTGTAAVRVLAATDMRAGPGETFAVVAPIAADAELRAIGRT
ncbi:MAG TPA: serine/threonine-protein kinase, partial [Promineifilum sp.]|nr:serine/threonine-protein kinase [Promineifilum sp.]